MNDTPPQAEAVGETGSASDPGTFPALCYRLLTGKLSVLARLLIAVTILVAILVAAIWCIGDVSIDVGPVTVGRPAPASVIPG